MTEKADPSNPTENDRETRDMTNVTEKKKTATVIKNFGKVRDPVASPELKGHEAAIPPDHLETEDAEEMGHIPEVNVWKKVEITVEPPGTMAPVDDLGTRTDVPDG